MNTVRFQISPSGEMGAGKMTMTAASAESGDNVGDIDATVDGEAVEIAFNARYLADVLNVLHSPQVAIETSGSSSPGVIKAVNRDDFTHVIMPMHLGK
jgi:DNA polymerase-3 subunit beta